MRRIVLGFWIVWSAACAPQTTAPEATPQASDAPVATDAPQGATTEAPPATPSTVAEATPASPAPIAEVPPTRTAPAEVAPAAPPAERPAPPTHAPTPRPTPPPRPGPRPSAPRPSGMGACETAADCVVHCAKAPGCCPDAPCGCRNAIRKDKVAEYDAWFASSCTPTRACPAVGCAWDEAFGATCREGRCVATDGPL